MNPEAVEDGFYDNVPARVLSTDEAEALSNMFGEPTNNVETWNIDVDGLPPLGLPVLLLTTDPDNGEVCASIGVFHIGKDYYNNWALNFGSERGNVHIPEGSVAYDLLSLVQNLSDYQLVTEIPEDHDECAQYLRLSEEEPDHYDKVRLSNGQWAMLNTFTDQYADYDGEHISDLEVYLLPGYKYVLDQDKKSDSEDDDDDLDEY